MDKKGRLSVRAALAGLILVAAPQATSAYTRDNHKLYIERGAKLCDRVHTIKIKTKVLYKIIDGVLEPDKLTRQAFQIVEQRFEPDSYGKQRDVSVERIAAQAIHGSPSPTRKQYGNRPDDLAKLKKTIRISETRLMPDRFPLDVYSYHTNQALRNKILITASQFLCISFAHKNQDQSARKFGNMMHMIGDTYSASHVQRSAPKGNPGKCGTEKIEWHFSMDLIAWKLHAPADEQNRDWRFRCIVEHTASLMKLWFEGRRAVQREVGKSAVLNRANEQVRRTMMLLCNKILREDPDVLSRPSGGAAAGFSITSGTDNWEFYKQKKPDTPIQPIGLTSVEEANVFVRKVNRRLRKNESDMRFWYPSRDMQDLCRDVVKDKPLPEPLRCTAQEIDWAVQGSKQVRTMWIPERQLPQIIRGE